ncbi:hypothetical protein ABR777_15980 [Bacillus cereus]
MENNKIFITEEINEWIGKTWSKHQVNVVAFAFDWIHRFMTIQIHGMQNISGQAKMISKSMSMI